MNVSGKKNPKPYQKKHIHKTQVIKETVNKLSS